MLKFNPKPGSILICDYGNHAVVPEMVKKRPVVVVSPKLKKRAGLCSVVPLSTTAPDIAQDFNCILRLDPPLPSPFDSPEMWVKGDMIATVGYHRLNLIWTGRDQYGKRKYLAPIICSADLRAVYCAVLNGLGLGRLTPHL